MLLSILIPLLAILAVGSWLVAVFSALSLVSLAPKGEKITAYFALGWWRFDKVRAIVGPKADTYITRYRTAFLVFLRCNHSWCVGTFVMTMPS